MAKKKKQKTFSAVKAVKELARERIGPAPVSRVVPDKRTPTQRAKPTLKELLAED